MVRRCPKTLGIYGTCSYDADKIYEIISEDLHVKDVNSN